MMFQLLDGDIFSRPSHLLAVPSCRPLAKVVLTSAGEDRPTTVTRFAYPPCYSRRLNTDRLLALFSANIKIKTTNSTNTLLHCGSVENLIIILKNSLCYACCVNIDSDSSRIPQPSSIPYDRSNPKIQTRAYSATKTPRYRMLPAASLSIASLIDFSFIGNFSTIGSILWSAANSSIRL